MLKHEKQQINIFANYMGWNYDHLSAAVSASCKQFLVLSGLVMNLKNNSPMQLGEQFPKAEKWSPLLSVSFSPNISLYSNNNVFRGEATLVVAGPPMQADRQMGKHASK